jgi:hypothetical protein
LLFIGLPAFAQQPRESLHFTSGKAQQITVYKGQIIVNGNKTYKLGADNIVYTSKRNRLWEDAGNVYLFLEVTAAPNKNRYYIFAINNSIADSLMSTVSSDVKDWDRDGLLEFGGSDVTPVYPAADSMYYVPSKYYEIKKGAIIPDAQYTEKIDKKVNGTYLPDPLDNSGRCCKVIKKPKGRA